MTSRPLVKKSTCQNLVNCMDLLKCIHVYVSRYENCARSFQIGFGVNRSICSTLHNCTRSKSVPKQYNTWESSSIPLVLFLEAVIWATTVVYKGKLHIIL